MAKLLKSTSLALLFAAFANATWSAEPEPGMWGIDGEVNGKPGRGVQIDTQGGNLLIATYFGYRADGTALFLQASGPMVENAYDALFPSAYTSTFPIAFEGNLVEYKGGTVLAGPRQDGQSAGIVGKLQIQFDSATTGSITLPGEPSKRISRFRYEDASRRFGNQFSGGMSLGIGASFLIQGYNMSVGGGTFDLRRNGDGGNCHFTGTYILAGKGITSSGIYSCGDSTTGTYRSDELVVTSDGVFTGTLYRTSTTGVVQVEHHYALCYSSVGGGGLPRCGRMQ